MGDPTPVRIRGLNRSHNVTPSAGIPRLQCTIYSSYWCVPGWPRCGLVPRTEWLYASNRQCIKNSDSIGMQLSYAFRQAEIPSFKMGSDRTVQGPPLLRPWILRIHRQQSHNLCVNVCQTKCLGVEVGWRARRLQLWNTVPTRHVEHWCW